MCKNTDQVKTFLSSDFKIINNWFLRKFHGLKPRKSHFMCIDKEIDDAETLNFNDLAIKFLTFLVPIPDKQKKFNLNFYFQTSL